MRPFEKCNDFLVTFFFITKSLSLFLVIASFFLPVIASLFLPVIATFPFPVIARNEATKQSLIAVRHCEPKGWQVCWREAISPLHIPVGVRRSGGIASLTAFARNDEKGVFARNDAIGLFALNGVTKTLLIGLQRSYFSIFLLKYKGKL